jgi:hypothetical protein
MALPGVKTIIKDRFYSISRQDSPVGPRVVVIAKRTTADGIGNVADLDVVLCTNEQDVITAFGENSGCHRAFFELVSAGAERIFMVPLPSDTTWNHSSGSVTSSNFGGSVFEAMFIAAEAAQPDIILPWGSGARAGLWAATPSESFSASSDTIYGFHADNTATVANNWAVKIADAVRTINENSHPCFAILGTKPYTGTNDVMTPGQVSTHLALTNLSDRDSATTYNGIAAKELGRHVAVIGSELKPANYPAAWGYANGSAALAAAVSRMASYTSTINKTVYNIAALRYNASKTTLLAMTNKGVNSIMLNFNRAPIFTDGVTFAGASSDYTRLTTLRIVNEAMLVVRQSCQKFIGQPSTIQVRNSMETSITSSLRGMQQLGAILDSDFNIRYIAEENKALIDLVITPAFELRNIEVQMSVELG